jgi:hypothetical protein
VNRQQRRAHDKAHKKTPVLVAGDGIIAAAMGQKYEARPAAELAPKRPGVHRWIATGAWVLSDDAVIAAHDADTLKFLDNENLMALSIGCWDCEAPLGAIQPGSTCPSKGDPNG